MANDTKRRVLQLSRVNGDGRMVEGPILLVLRDPATGNELRADDGTPEVFMHLKAVDEAERAAIIATHTRLERDPNNPRTLSEFMDAKAANDDILDRAIVRWEGIAGADGRPLVCTRQTKLLLDAPIRGQVMRKVFGAEVAEVLAASFL